MQTILGSGGAIGIELAKALKGYTSEIRLVSRTPQRINPGDELVSADLTDADDALRAIEGSEVAYLTVGLPYDTGVWERAWPVLMENTIEGCRRHGARLVFFDNIYMYDPEHLDPITEDTPVNPGSRKGEVRASIARMLMDAVERGELRALIARSADFYGPSVGTSALKETVFATLAEGKKANWLGSADCVHSFTYTPDAGRATALLGNTDDAYGQVWHLPTPSERWTGKDWVEAVAREMRVAPKYRSVPRFMVRLMGLFMPLMKEMVEMMYQYERDYFFDSDKFEKRFDFEPTPYPEGIRKIVEHDYRHAAS